MNPKLYEVFLFRNMRSIKRVFNTIYIFFNDIRLYLLTYNVITNYFRRLKTTKIANVIADHILIHIYKNYLIPRLFLNSKQVKLTPHEFQDKFLINKFSDKYKDKLYDLLEFLDTESLKLSETHIDNIVKSISLRLFDDENYLELNPNEIKFKYFVEEICYYSLKNKTLITDNNELEFEIDKFKTHLGEWLIASFEEMSVINLGWKFGSRNINILDLNNEKKTDAPNINTIEFNKDIINKNLNKIKHILPNNLPMICNPVNWSDNQSGGYLNNNFLDYPLIAGIGVNNSHEVKNLDNLYKAINYSSNIKFAVNFEALDFILINKENLFKDYYDGINLSEINDHILRDTVTLEVAKTYRNIPFYLNTYADWRLRIYTNSHYLSYQSSDISLSLINFYDGEVLTERGFHYLCIYGANLYDENNMSKEPYDKRIQWVLKNEIKILSLDIDFIVKADQRFTFISFCLAYKRYKNKEKVYLPISMDATCSALQLFSSLLLDEDLAKAVNVIPNENDRVNDIYSEMLEPINENILNFVKENPEYKNLGLLKLKRKNVKTPLMTVVYSSSTHGRSIMLASSFKKVKIEDINKLNKDLLFAINKNKAIDLSEINFEDDIQLENNDNNFLLEVNEDKDKEIIKDHLKYLYEAPSKDISKPLYLTFKEIFKLAELIHESLFNSYPILKNIFDYFNSISKVYGYLDIPISWTPPSGAHITQKYLKVRKVKIFISVGRGKQKTVILSQKLNDIDIKSQFLALNPNYIHSLDSSLCIALL